MYCINLTHIKFCSLHQSQCKLIILNPETLGLISTCICTCTCIKDFSSTCMDIWVWSVPSKCSILHQWHIPFLLHIQPKKRSFKIKKCPTVESLQFNNFFNDCIIVQEWVFSSVFGLQCIWIFNIEYKLHKFNTS